MTIVANSLNRLRPRDTVYNLSPTWPPYHVFGFIPKALRVLLDKHGFRVTNVRVWAAPNIPASGGVRDHIAAVGASQIARIANWTGKAANMLTLARKR